MAPAADDVDLEEAFLLQSNPLYADEAHIDIGFSVPASVPKPGPRTIHQQPTPTKEPIKNGPEIVNFRPVL